MKRWLCCGLFSLLSLLLVLAISLSLLLGTQGGSRWLLAQVPGLQVDDFDGRLGGSWSATQLRWQQGENSVQVMAPSLDWSPTCLLRLTLCIEQLRSGPISLVFPDDEQPSRQPFSLPDLSLPLALQLGQVQIDSVVGQGSTFTLSLPPNRVSASGPSPHRQATGMPCTLPDGVTSLVLKSECASSHSTRRSLPCSRHQRATAVIEPMPRQWSPPSMIGMRPACSSA